jgi:hypothetical protein
LLWVLFNLAECDCLKKTTRSLKAQRETTNAAEQVQHSQGLHFSPHKAAQVFDKCRGKGAFAP